MDNSLQQNTPFDADKVAKPQYKAFISYSHGDNREQGRKWADWLHHSLETYEIPNELIGKINAYGKPIPNQIYPIFQDEKELSASADLEASLQRALDNSEFLIYLSSPRSARSIYVQEEIKYFKKTGRADKIIALIISGEPEYGDQQTDNQCFPDALRYDVDTQGNILYDHHAEALAADVRLPDNSEQGFTSIEAYRQYLQSQSISGDTLKTMTNAYQERLNLAKLKIIATILGVSLRELTKRDKAYQLERAKHKTRIMQRVAGAIGVLAILATGSGVYAWQQKNAAQKNFAQSLFTSGINKLAQNEYGDPAAYIAAAVRSGSKNATQFAESMLAIRDDMMLLPNLRTSGSVFSPDGHYVAGYADMGNDTFILQLWDVYQRKKISDIATVKNLSLREPVFDQVGNLYFINEKSQVIRYNIANKNTTAIYTAPEESRPSLTTTAASATASTSPTTANSNETETTTTTTQTAASSTAATTDEKLATALKNTFSSFRLVSVSPDGRWLAIKPLIFGEDNIELINTANPAQKHRVTFPKSTFKGVIFSEADPAKGNDIPATSTAVVYAGDTNQFFGQLIQLTGQPNASSGIKATDFRGNGSIRSLILSKDNRLLLAHNKENDLVIDPATGSMTPLITNQAYYTTYAFNPDNRTIMAFGSDEYAIYDRNTGQQLQAQKLPMRSYKKLFESHDYYATDFSPDMTQELKELNKQLYLRNDNGNPLLTADYHFGDGFKDVMPTVEGDYLIALSDDTKHIDKMNVETGAKQPNFIQFPESIRALKAISQHRLMVTGISKTLYFYDLATGKLIGKPIKTQLRITPLLNKDETQVLARTSDTAFGIWQINDGNKLSTFTQLPKQANFVTDKTFKYAVIGEENRWQIKSVADGQTLLSGAEKLNGATFSDDGHLAALITNEAKISVYDLTTKKLKFTIPSITGPMVQFSPDGKTLVASMSSQRLKLWHTDNGKDYGQVIPVASNTQLLDFSKDSSKLFIQDKAQSETYAAVKIIDVETGNLISLPFASRMADRVYLVNDNQRLVTINRLPADHNVAISQVPTGLNLPPSQLADDLEAFYGRKYDSETGAITAYTGKHEFKTWFFQDLYTRAISPTSNTSVVSVIERQIPIKTNESLQTLASSYFYHPLARASLAEYFSRQAGTGTLAQQLVNITKLQLNRMSLEPVDNKTADTRKQLTTKTNSLLSKAQQQINQIATTPVATPVVTTPVRQASATVAVNTTRTTASEPSR